MDEQQLLSFRTGHVDNTIDIEAPIDFVFTHTNDVRNWTSLFTEYADVQVLQEGDSEMLFRLTLPEDAQGRVWSWVSHRVWDTDTYTVRARRIEKGPFLFMNIHWSFESLAADRTRMRWTQDFEMKPDAPLDTEAMTKRIDTNTHTQMAVIKERLERRRRRVVDQSEVAANTRRGGDLRTMLTPSTVGSAFGFGGVLRLAAGEQVSEHYHPFSEESVYLVRGGLRIDLDDEPVELGPEQAVLIPRNVRHRLVNAGDDEALAVFHLAPLAPSPERGHVDTEPEPVVVGES